MRTFKKFVPLLVALLSITTQVHAADVPATFNFTGAGYGYGVGMSQIGAKARATSGESATAILKYYYKNVEIVPYDELSRRLRNTATSIEKLEAGVQSRPPARRKLAK